MSGALKPCQNIYLLNVCQHKNKVDLCYLIRSKLMLDVITSNYAKTAAF